MKKIWRIAICVLVVSLMAATLVACGSSKEDESSTSDAVSMATNVVPADTQEAVLPAADPKLGDDSVIGTWVQVDDSTRTATITKTDSGYTYKDNEGEYTATFADGVLKVKVSDTDTADVYYDAASKNLLAVYQGAPTRFTKQQ